jgi:hypothetical protein
MSRWTKRRENGNRPLHLQDRKAVQVHETKPVYPEGEARLQFHCFWFVRNEEFKREGGK